MFRNALFLCAGIAAVAPAFAMTAPLPQAVNTAVDAGDYVAAETALKESLRGKTIAPGQSAFRAALLLEVIRETGADVLSRFAAKDAKHAAFLKAFANDAEWQEIYLSAGLVPHQTDVGIDVLCRIWVDCKGEVKNKPLATALASVWGGGETAPKPNILLRNPATHNPVWRYRFFEKRAAKGLLHPNYKNLRAWELRFVVGIPAQDWDDRSFQWAADNINLPWDRYCDACWAAPYTDPSKFGDSVQSGLYNLPFTGMSDAETTQRNGGVCGALSHLGTVAAMAHGIPAYTCGQPGHCAYGVRPERGKWIGGFGGPDGGMHNHIFGSQAPDSYLLMEEVFKDDAATSAAYRESICARAKEAVGDTDGAIASWKKALEYTPLHPFFRAQLHRLMLAQGLTPDACYDYLSKLIPLYKGNGISAVNVAKDLAPVFNKLDDSRKVALYTAMHRVIATTPSSWASKYTEIFQEQFDALSTDQTRRDLLAAALGAHINSKDGTVFGRLLEWGVKGLVEKGKDDLFAAAFAEAASATKTADGSDSERLKSVGSAYDKAIVATEKARSVVAFGVLTEAARKAMGTAYKAGALTKTGEMKGKPAKGVLFRSSSTSGWDTPVLHQGIMTLAGGKCHSDREKTPSFIAEIDKGAELTGCIIRKADGNEGRMKKAVVYTSSDGATWMPRATTNDMPKEWVVSFPAATTGKWVKVEFENEAPDFAHITHFVIYTR